MVTHSSILAWRIPWTEKPGRLQSTGWQRIWHDWATERLHFPWPRIQHGPPALELRSLSRWTAREVPTVSDLWIDDYGQWEDVLFYFLGNPQGLLDLLDLSCLTRDWTWASAVKTPSPTHHWTAREFPRSSFISGSLCQGRNFDIFWRHLKKWAFVPYVCLIKV